MMELRLCIVGFGNAARAFCRLLADKAKWIEEEHGCKVVVTAIAGRSKGTVLKPEGLDLLEILKSEEICGRLSDKTEDLTTLNAVELIGRSGADALVELSTLSIFDGQPAIRHVEEAFRNGMHVITANKGPIAWDCRRLTDMSSARGLQFLYETVVMDGTPVFNLVRETLPGCRILGFRGILNSTTNFILDEMGKGNSFDDAVREAQRRGFAEADPSLDIDGWDAAAKTAAIANAIMGIDLKPTEISRVGISGITAEEIEQARRNDTKLKLVCRAGSEGGKVTASVCPEPVGCNDVYSLIDATSSIISIMTDMMGEISIIEKDPEIEQTAYGIFSDLLTLLGRIPRNS